MANNDRNPQEHKGAAAEVMQRGAVAVGETAQAKGSALRRAAATATGAAEQEGGEVSEAMHRSGEAGGEAIRRSGEAVGNTVRQGAHAAAEGQGWLVEDMACQVEETGRQLTQAIQDSADNMRTLLALSGVTGRGLPDLQQTMGNLVGSVMQTNLRATQEMVRLVNPGTVYELQQRFARDCLDTLLEGSTNLLHSARRVTEETLRPLEEQLEQRQQQRKPPAHQEHGQRHGRVADMMSRKIYLASPDDTVLQASQIMRQENTGVLPVGENDRIVGMLTARDLALRLVAESRDPAKTKVREVMTVEGHYVFEDEDLRRAGDTMAEQKVHRLPVVNRDKRLVGIVSLSDLATNGQSPQSAGRLGTPNSQVAAAE